MFPTPSAMCRHWHVNPDTLRNRLSAGWDLGRALATPAARSRPVTDALGRSFPSVRAACEANGLSTATYRRRVAAGETPQEALRPTGERRWSGPCFPVTDADGVTYPSARAACAARGVPRSTYARRRSAGEDPVYALMPRSSSCLCQGLQDPRLPARLSLRVSDHLGVSWPSAAAMFRHWGVPESTYYGRVRTGLDMRQRLEGPDLTHRPSAIFVTPFPTDPEGVIYDSVKAMCDAWGVDQSTFLTRLKLDWPLLDALSREPLRGVPLGRIVVGPDGDEHPSLNALCRAWGVVPWQLGRELSRDPSRSVAEALLAAIDRYGTLF